MCSDYTPVKTRRGSVVHALAWTKPAPECGKPSKSGYIVTDQPMNCLHCMARMVGLIRKRSRKAAAARGEATP